MWNGKLVPSPVLVPLYLLGTKEVAPSGPTATPRHNLLQYTEHRHELPAWRQQSENLKFEFGLFKFTVICFVEISSRTLNPLFVVLSLTEMCRN
jgi:hypothetical protein